MLADYEEFVYCFTGARENPYSLGYTYGRLLLSKGMLERAIRGLQQTSLLLPIFDKLDSKWHRLNSETDRLNGELINFLRACQENRELRQNLRATADQVEANITAEQKKLLLRLTQKEDVDSSNILSAVSVVDHLRLWLDERETLALQRILGLQRDQAELEAVFAELESAFWETLPTLLEFRSTFKEHRESFLILQDKKYPWWYPESRRVKRHGSPTD